METDWALQDAGEPLARWFLDEPEAGTEKQWVEQALQELGAEGRTLKTALDQLIRNGGPRADRSWLVLYVKVCEQRRAARLRSLLAKWRKIVFTKHFNLGGSHYAYTEAQSDAQAERNFQPGGALCVLELEGTRGQVRTLIDDPNGVIRDPDVSLDGRRILFAWKKSDREDDYHLYELDTVSGAVRQLTSGLGFADYEGCYLPNGDLLLNSTRCVPTVDCRGDCGQQSLPLRQGRPPSPAAGVRSGTRQLPHGDRRWPRRLRALGLQRPRPELPPRGSFT